MRVPVKGIKRYKHPKTGVWYTYHRPTGTRIEPPHQFGTAAFFAALADAERRHKQRPSPVYGTFGALVRSYRESSDFLDLRDRTRRDYLTVLDWLKGIDQMPVVEIHSAFIAGLREKAYRQHKRRFANYVLSVLSTVFTHAVERGLAKSNPVKTIRKIKRPIDAAIPNRAWTDDEKRVVLATAPTQLVLPIALGIGTGMREGDILKLGKTAYRDGILTWVTGKRGVPLKFPCSKALRAVLDEAPKNDSLTLCSNSYGRPWTESGFRASFFKHLRDLERQGLVGSGLTFHGLRTSFAEQLRMMGFECRPLPTPWLTPTLGQRQAMLGTPIEVAPYDGLPPSLIERTSIKTCLHRCLHWHLNELDDDLTN